MHGQVESLSFPWPDPPAPGKTIELAPGLIWLRLKLPYLLDHVNVYLLAHEEGWAVVDTGLGDDETRAAWDAVLQGPLARQKITSIIATHSHPDHMGLAGWLARRFGCRLTMTRNEYFSGAYDQAARTEELTEDRRDYFRRHGIPQETIEGLLGRGLNYLTFTAPLPPSYYRAHEGETLTLGSRTFELFTGGGHSPEQLMLLSREEKLFLSADQVLSKISPNVSVWPTEPDADALGLYIRSLTELDRDLPDDVLVLPGHGIPFYGVKTRIRQLLEHHERRCDEIATACDSRMLTSWELVPKIFHRPLDAHQSGFATGEVVAHLNYMVRQRRLEKHITAGGIMRFKTI